MTTVTLQTQLKERCEVTNHPDTLFRSDGTNSLNDGHLQFLVQQWTEADSHTHDPSRNPIDKKIWGV